MAQKTDIAAAKARKQKMILAVAGIGLVALAVIQVPKLMKGSSTPAAAPAASAAAATPAATAVVVSHNTSTLKPAAYVAGVALPGGTTVVVAKSQLASFTLFEAKDPFVQQVGDEVPAATATTTTTSSGSTAAAASSDSAAAASATSAPASPPVVYATVMFNGKPQQLKVKQKFPTGDPLFVLASVKKNSAKVGVAGGAFDDGQNVTLTLGKKVTLLDTATGVRYELKLVYTGSAPEQIEGFSTEPGQPAAATGSSSGGSSTVSTTAAVAP